MNDILRKIALELLVEAAPQYVPQNMKLPFSNISVASGGGNIQTQIMGDVFQQNDLPIQKFLDSFSPTDEGSQIRMTRMAITLLRFLGNQSQYEAYKEYSTKNGLNVISQYPDMKREIAPAYGFTTNINATINNIEEAKNYFIQILTGEGTGIPKQNLQEIIKRVAKKLSEYPAEEAERRVFLSYLQLLDNETNAAYKPSAIKEIITNFLAAPANAAPSSPGAADDAVATNRTSGSKVTLDDQVAEFVGLLEFMESRKETLRRMGLGNDDTTKQKMQIEIKDTDTFITRFYNSFKNILSFIFQGGMIGFKGSVSKSTATKKFLDRAKEYIYNKNDMSEANERKEDAFIKGLKEIEQIIPIFFGNLKEDPDLKNKSLLDIETKVKSYIKPVAQKILDYYESGNDPNKLVSLFNFTSLDIPEYSDASSTPTPPPVTETLNLNNKTQNTSKLIIESITKSKKISIKGTKEQITLFNKLIKEELSIMNKIKNNKPYVIPTKDIEKFESLTGIVWPFKG